MKIGSIHMVDYGFIEPYSFRQDAHQTLGYWQQQKQPQGASRGLERRIEECLTNNSSDFRTVKGISEELDIKPRLVKAILEKSLFSRKTGLKDNYGNDLYTHQKRTISLRERLAVLQQILAGPLVR
jgi:hypothetical protein